MENIQITTECIKKISNIGSNTYQNVCNGATSTVPWGILDWFVTLLLFGFITFLAVLIYKFFTE